MIQSLNLIKEQLENLKDNIVYKYDKQVIKILEYSKENLLTCKLTKIASENDVGA